MFEQCISVRNLTKSFGGRKVVDGLSFDVRKGKVFALLGHNGAGKSTTIDLIPGLKKPDKGSAQILGMDASENVFQNKRGFDLFHKRLRKGGLPRKCFGTSTGITGLRSDHSADDSRLFIGFSVLSSL